MQKCISGLLENVLWMNFGAIENTFVKISIMTPFSAHNLLEFVLKTIAMKNNCPSPLISFYLLKKEMIQMTIEKLVKCLVVILVSENF